MPPGHVVQLDLGDVVIFPVVEIPELKISPAEFFPELPPIRDQWWARGPWFDTQRGALNYTIQSFLVITPDHRILVDGCVGHAKDRHRPEFDQLSARWMQEFSATGYEPADVDTVIFTHLHVDHVGWATVKDADGCPRPTFPSAHHLVASNEFTYWTGPDGTSAMSRTGDYIADSIEPIRQAGKLDFAPLDARVSEHVELRPAQGHTPGNVVVHVRGSEGEAVLAGDVIHHPLQLAHPRLSTRYCVDPLGAAETRAALLTRCADEHTVIVPSHFASVPGGYVHRVAGGGFGWEPAEEIRRTRPALAKHPRESMA